MVYSVLICALVKTKLSAVQRMGSVLVLQAGQENCVKTVRSSTVYVV